MYFRLHMAETPRFTLHVLRNATAMTNGKYTTSFKYFISNEYFFDSMLLAYSIDMSDMLEGEAEAFDRVQSSKSIEEPVANEDIPFSQFLRLYGVQISEPVYPGFSWTLDSIPSPSSRRMSFFK